MRLDQAIAARNPQISRRQARQLIAERRVLVNERPVAIASREVADSDRIAIIDVLPQLEVLKITDDFVAVNKPAGMPTQPTRDRKQRSLEELLRAKFRSIFLVHRLDAGTSGAVVFAQTREAAASLSDLFARGEVRKTYLAQVEPPMEGPAVVDTPLAGKSAFTEIEPFGSNVVVYIRTGRTHQIRIHLASIGHPVVGDRRYGGRAASRLMLHAWKLEHESFGAIEAPPPDDLIPSRAPWKPK
ncbi:MAG TPA: RluA family pseudouridine synthase [Thermoanaerobaculia bacterium]|nr:RluA family pseudouridine synthase [Thermoanaerobaculia bacterium]